MTYSVRLFDPTLLRYGRFHLYDETKGQILWVDLPFGTRRTAKAAAAMLTEHGVSYESRQLAEGMALESWRKGQRIR